MFHSYFPLSASIIPCVGTIGLPLCMFSNTSSILLLVAFLPSDFHSFIFSYLKAKMIYHRNHQSYFSVSASMMSGLSAFPFACSPTRRASCS